MNVSTTWTKDGKPLKNGWEEGAVRLDETTAPTLPEVSPDVARLDAIRAKILAQTATAAEVREYLSLKIKGGTL